MTTTHRLSYRNVFGTGERPYLAVHVTGLNGASGDIPGLIDSGADRTSLPMGFARLMGYDSSTLEQGKIGIADGSEVAVLVAKVPVQANVVGLPDPTFELCPTFVGGNNVHALWGRADVFMNFGIGFDETNQSFSLTVP